MRRRGLAWARSVRLVVAVLLVTPSVAAAVPTPDTTSTPGTDPTAAAWRDTGRSAALGLRAGGPGPRPDGRQETAIWAWPLSPVPEIVKGFDPPARRWLPGHRGIDLAGVAGEPVLAVEAGVVTYSGQIAGVGVVSVTHASGLRSTYQPVTDRVGRGVRVGREDPLGTLDSAGSHCPLLGCLHLGALRGRDHYVDPTPLLLGVELALVPVSGG